MQTLLSQLFTHAHSTTDHVSDVTFLVRCLFNETEITSKDIEAVVPKGVGETPREYLDYLKLRLAVLLIQKLRGVVGVKLPPLEKRYSGSPLVLALINLYNYFESGDGAPPADFSMLFANHGVLDGQIPDMAASVELGVVTLILGIMLDNRELKVHGCEIAQLISNLFHPKSGAFLPLWIREREYNLSELLSNTYLLFHLASAVCASDLFSELAASLHGKLTKIEASEAEEIPPLSILLAAVIEPSLVDVQGVEYTEGQSKLLNSLSMHVNRSSDRLEVMTLTGIGTGLGGIIKGDQAILNFGPGEGHVGNTDTFGVYKQAWSDSLKKEGNTIRGWTRLCSPVISEQSRGCLTQLEMSRDWMELKAVSKIDSIEIDVRFTLPEEKKRTFLFFIRSNKVSINENFDLLPDSLDRYDGDSCDLVAKGADSEMHIAFDGITQMEVIPLAGRNFYWGADFLIAYRVEESDRKYHWSIN